MLWMMRPYRKAWVAEILEAMLVVSEESAPRTQLMAMAPGRPSAYALVG